MGSINGMTADRSKKVTIGEFLENMEKELDKISDEEIRNAIEKLMVYYIPDISTSYPLCFIQPMVKMARGKGKEYAYKIYKAGKDLSKRGSYSNGVGDYIDEDKLINAITKDTKLYEFCEDLDKYCKPNEKTKGEIRKIMKDVFGIDLDENLMINQLDAKVNKAGIKQIILHGAPGTGKTYTAKKFAKDNGFEVEIIQFHPSYDYTDFVEGLRPVQLKGDNPTFVRMDGEFKAFCRKADKDKSKKFCFIIDEINRADVSKVLGELMYLMNDTKRTPHEKNEPDKVKTPYRNLPTYYDDNGTIKKYRDSDAEKDAFKDGFYIPENVIIIGTMNDIDRSVDAFDFALRRRFSFVKADANLEAEESLHEILSKDKESEEVKDCLKRLQALNKVITEEGKDLGLNDDYHIGAAYFSGCSGSREELSSLFENNIKPLIAEYCRGKNPDKVKDFLEKCSSAFCSSTTAGN